MPHSSAGHVREDDLAGHVAVEREVVRDQESVAGLFLVQNQVCRNRAGEESVPGSRFTATIGAFGERTNALERLALELAVRNDRAQVRHHGLDVACQHLHRARRNDAIPS